MIGMSGQFSDRRAECVFSAVGSVNQATCGRSRAGASTSSNSMIRSWDVLRAGLALVSGRETDRGHGYLPIPSPGSHAVGSPACPDADGTELEVGPGDIFEMPPGHDAWVVGDEPWISVDFEAMRTYGKQRDLDLPCVGAWRRTLARPRRRASAADGTAFATTVTIARRLPEPRRRPPRRSRPGRRSTLHGSSSH